MFAACASDAATVSSCPPSRFRSEPPLVIAHAGGEGLGPPNSIIAMRRSLDAGADVLDVDVRMTTDGVIVGAHDRNVTSITTANGNVDELTWAQLRSLDMRGRWTGAPIDEPVRIASLEEILVAFPEERLSIEIKQTTPPLAEPLCDLLRSTGSIDRIYLSSNDDGATYAAQAACPAETVITTTYRDVAAMREARESGVPWCAPSPIGQPPYRPGRFEPDDVNWSHDHGMAIYTWTVDDPATLEQLAAAGVDGVYTRRPDIARQVFDGL
jgi:glycerophosphoryl diester phosphodiesterase